MKVLFFTRTDNTTGVPESLGDSDDTKAKRENTASALESRG